MKIQPKFLLRVAGGLAAATLLSLIASGVAFWTATRTIKANRLVQEKLETIKNLDDVLAQIKDAENGRWKYLLTGDGDYLQPYVSATINIEQKIELIRQIEANDPNQISRLNKLQILVKNRFNQIKKSIDMRHNQGFNAAIINAKINQETALTDQIGWVIRQMEAEEKGVLLQLQKEAANSAKNAILAFSVGIFLNLLIFGWVYKIVYTEIRKRTQTEKEIQHLNEDLERRVFERTQDLEKALQHLQQSQSQLIQAEKMSSLGQLVAGVAHEINNPVNFIYGNLSHANDYAQDLLRLLSLYQKHYPNPVPEVQEEAEDIDIDFLIKDFPKLLSSMKIGADRIQKIVLSLRNFSRMDEAEVKAVDIHEGIESTLMILQHRLKAKPDHPAIKVIKEYGNLSLVECYAGQLNQVFMNILSNAVDALEERDSQRIPQELQEDLSMIRISTEMYNSERVRICIADNGPGIAKEVQQRLFHPFFTTKPVGKGTGMGMSISYQIVTEKHQGSLRCVSDPGKGAEFWIEIPVRQIAIQPQQETGLLNNVHLTVNH